MAEIIEAELDFSTMISVVETWELLRSIDNYEEVVALNVFQRIFEECPNTKVLFGFPKDKDPKWIARNESFKQQARHFIRNIDTIVSLLGPDTEVLTETILHLGEKLHSSYRIKPEFAHAMGQALLDMLQDLLKDHITENARKSWDTTFKAISTVMMKVLIDRRRSV